MNILITGGAGYIGAELCNKLSTLPEIKSITVYDNLLRKNHNFFINYKLNPSKVKFVEGDLLDSRKLKSALKGINVVYHTAALTDKNPSLDSHIFEQINHWGTSELVNAVEESGVSTLIYTSSASVYGNGTEIFNEESAPNPSSFYATSKWRGEEQVKRLLGKKKYLIFRLANVYGFSPCMRFDGVINRFMLDANYKGRIQIHGNGRQLRNYIHINQVVEALTKSLSLNVDSCIFNLSDKNLQVLDIVEAMQEIYPSLEFIFINQHLKIEDQQIQVNETLQKVFNLKSSDFGEDLKLFKSQFSF
jgi:UDP-glucose 4-epimerase